ncbi:MAG: hypothetical protein IT459_11980 [Planctomycetes bacterium]|nr:hypothetical protein [Planctomycetota bacterium]
MILHRLCGVAFATTAILGAASATTLQPTIVSDTAGDKLWKCVDVNGDGDLNDAGEVTAFYDDTVGSIPLSDPTGLAFDAFGRLFVSDTTEDRIFRFEDVNQDGDVNDVGEATVVFDGNVGGNASNVRMVSGNSLYVEASGRIWVASNNQIISSVVTGEDLVFHLDDLNSDGDCNDVGEATVFFKPAPGGAVGDSIPNDVMVLSDGTVLYLENGVTATPKRGIYRLVDGDASGVIDQPSEVNAFFIAPAQAGNAFHFGFARTPTDDVYVLDHGNDLCWKVKDFDSNGDAQGPGEFTAFFNAGTGSTMWQCDVAQDGSLYIGEDGTPDRLYVLTDSDNSGSIAGAEQATVYTDTLATTDIGTPRCVAVIPVLGPAYPGNGTDAAMQVAVNGLFVPNPAGIYPAFSGDTITIGFTSPNGSLNGTGMVLLLQPFLTGNPPTALTIPGDPSPALWLDPSFPFFILLNGISNSGGSAIGSQVPVSFPVPPGVNGLGASAMFVLLVDDPFKNAANLGAADAVEIRLP